MLGLQAAQPPVEYQHARVLEAPPAHQLPQSSHLLLRVSLGQSSDLSEGTKGSVRQIFLNAPLPYEECSGGVYTGEVVGDLARPQHPLDTVGPQLVPLSTVGVAQSEAHLLLLSVHRGGFLQTDYLDQRQTNI